MHSPARAPEVDRYAPDGRYAEFRLAVSLAIATLAGAGMWAIVVVLPAIQAEFAIPRAAASLPYTASMLGFAFGSIVLGRMVDRTGIVPPVLIAASCLGLGFVLAGLASDLWMLSLVHLLLIGVGAGTGFAPMMADISHWFVRRRGFAVVIVASGNYLAGVIWPLALNWSLPAFGWRASFIGMGLLIVALMVPLALMLRRRPTARTLSEAATATDVARADLGLPPGTLTILLTIAGFSCCVAMSMPQVHIVAYCGDLGYGVARGAEMLALMLGLGIISRIGSGIVADRIGGAATLLIGSLMQGIALMLYLFFNGLASLYVISGIFGLFQGGIVPMYAVICREFLPPREAGQRIGIVVAATIFGMAFGGYVSGLIFDATASYRLAFLNGVLWNAVNLAVVGWLVWRRQKAMPQSA